MRYTLFITLLMKTVSAQAKVIRGKQIKLLVHCISLSVIKTSDGRVKLLVFANNNFQKTNQDNGLLQPALKAKQVPKLYVVKETTN